MLEIGYPHDLMRVIGALELICLVLYAIPATSEIGAIILTGFLDGAIASHLRVAEALTPVHAMYATFEEGSGDFRLLGGQAAVLWILEFVVRSPVLTRVAAEVRPGRS